MIFSRAERREKEVVATFALGMLILTPVWAVGEYLSSMVIHFRRPVSEREVEHELARLTARS